ncbi:hypothetical protein AB0L34_15235 [Micromonospora sp. NPDC052213]|uniref:hypothetical protein n=1 Tax=Micromonospora sp. NPDC052213 TaxID=3155812 RepID=UPI0034328514
MLLLVAFSVSLSWVWTTLALLMRSPGAVLGVTQAVRYPLSFFSNIFVVPATLPGPLRAFVDLNPVTHPVMRRFLPERVRRPEWVDRLMAEYFGD